MAELFIMIFEIMLVIFGGIALVVLVYCFLTRKVFKEVYPKAVECVVTWIMKEFGHANDIDTVCRMNRDYIEPIIEILGGNGCQCVERNAVILVTQQVAQYELQLSNKVKELDLAYLEKLVQVAYYNDVLPLYSNAGIRKEDIDVFIRREGKNMMIYVGHCQKAYTSINLYRNEVRQREIEKLNKECQEMIE